MRTEFFRRFVDQVENLVVDKHHKCENEILQDYLAIKPHLLNFLLLYRIKIVNFNQAPKTLPAVSALLRIQISFFPGFYEHKLYDHVVKSVRILHVFLKNILFCILHRENFDVALIILVRVVVLD